MVVSRLSSQSCKFHLLAEIILLVTLTINPSWSQASNSNKVLGKNLNRVDFENKCAQVNKILKCGLQKQHIDNDNNLALHYRFSNGFLLIASFKRASGLGFLSNDGAGVTDIISDVVVKTPENADQHIGIDRGKFTAIAIMFTELLDPAIKPVEANVIVHDLEDGYPHKRPFGSAPFTDVTVKDLYIHYWCSGGNLKLPAIRFEEAK